MGKKLRRVKIIHIICSPARRAVSYKNLLDFLSVLFSNPDLLKIRAIIGKKQQNFANEVEARSKSDKLLSTSCSNTTM